MASTSTTPPHPPNGAPASGSTPALAPAQSSTKRLSTVKASPGAGTGAGVVAGAGGPGAAGAGAKYGAGKDVMSPGELCGFVDTMMSQLETRFDEFSEQMLSRMDDMSTRIDNLENTIQDLMHSDIDELDGKAPGGATR